MLELSESIIDVKLTDEGKWGLYLDNVLIGQTKSNCDCMLAARRLAFLYEKEPKIVNHYGA